jgi:transposase-like protein
MDQKMMLIGDWLCGDYSKSKLARYYGVSRPTVHKWIKRYEQEGNRGLEERSRAPLSCPHQTGDQIVKRLIEAKQQHMDWGPKKTCQVSAGAESSNGLASVQHSRRDLPKDWPGQSTQAYS